MQNPSKRLWPLLLLSFTLLALLALSMIYLLAPEWPMA